MSPRHGSGSARGWTAAPSGASCALRLAQVGSLARVAPRDGGEFFSRTYRTSGVSRVPASGAAAASMLQSMIAGGRFEGGAHRGGSMSNVNVGRGSGSKSVGAAPGFSRFVRLLACLVVLVGAGVQTRVDAAP